ncbi:MAG: hypothetical protein EBY44_03110 [Actinobacteria bacterium]|nr:hypothetical protein [Actinomycetota bacterium]
MGRHPGVLQETCRALTRLRDEAAARSLAELVVRRYANLTRARDDEAKRSFFDFLVRAFAPDPTAVAAAIDAYRRAPDATTAHDLWAASEAPRLDLFRSINLADDGIHTLLTMRADALRLRDGTIAPAERDLAYLLSSWFNRGFLELRAIDWQTPAETLEKLIEYEAVHEIRGWDDLRRRLEHDRRCYGFFHPSLPAEPLIFVEIALVHGLATHIEAVIDAPVPNEDLTDPEGAHPADTAIFYSITNCQTGLRGIPLGDFLLKQVTDELQRTVPLNSKMKMVGNAVPPLLAFHIIHAMLGTPTNSPKTTRRTSTSSGSPTPPPSEPCSTTNVRIRPTAEQTVGRRRPLRSWAWRPSSVHPRPQSCSTRWSTIPTRSGRWLATTGRTGSLAARSPPRKRPPMLPTTTAMTTTPTSPTPWSARPSADSGPSVSRRSMAPRRCSTTRVSTTLPGECTAGT